MRKNLIAAAAVLAALGGSVAATAPAYAADPVCGGYGPGARLQAASVKSLSTSETVGVVELCQRIAEGNVIRWATVRIGATTGGFASGDGRIVSRNVDGEVVSTCDPSRGGTGLLSATRRTCSTGSLPAGSQERASAYLYDSTNKLVATGTTSWIG